MLQRCERCDFAKRLIGFCSDGANVNKGNKTGVMAEIKKEISWLVFIWCMAHRLELAIKESLGGTKFNDIDEMLLNIYLLYEKSSKKLSQLEELAVNLKDLYEFTSKGIKPMRSNGTRWIDKFGVYMQHLKDMSEDRSYKSDQRIFDEMEYNKYTYEHGILSRYSPTSLIPVACLSERRY